MGRFIHRNKETNDENTGRRTEGSKEDVAKKRTELIDS